MGLTRAAILEANEMQPVVVPVPEWGGDVLVRPLTLGEMSALLPKIQRDGDVSVDLVIACACDDSGVLLFSPDDADALRSKHYAAMQRVAMVALKVNRMRKEDTEELEKN